MRGSRGAGNGGSDPPENHKVSLEISVDLWKKGGHPPPPPLVNVGPQLEPRSELEPLRTIVFLKKLSITEYNLIEINKNVVKVFFFCRLSLDHP